MTPIVDKRSLRYLLPAASVLLCSYSGVDMRDYYFILLSLAAKLFLFITVLASVTKAGRFMAALSFALCLLSVLFSIGHTDGITSGVICLLAMDYLYAAGYLVDIYFRRKRAHKK